MKGVIPNALYEPEVTKLFARETISKFYNLEDLKPYTAYSFRLLTSNSFGHSNSEWSGDYHTSESVPRLQENPTVHEITSTSVSVSWKGPRISNGIIRYYTLNVYQTSTEYVENLVLYRNYTMTSRQFQIQDLEPFTNYSISIDACNTKGCVISSVEANRTVLFTTQPSKPIGLENPTLISINSYSVQINWKMPKKPNGIISSYLLERRDYKPLLSENRNHGNFTSKYRSYKFDSEFRMFIDFEQLEACGVYSYRMFVYNQVNIVLILFYHNHY